MCVFKELCLIFPVCVYIYGCVCVCVLFQIRTYVSSTALLKVMTSSSPSPVKSRMGRSAHRTAPMSALTAFVR